MSSRAKSALRTPALTQATLSPPSTNPDGPVGKAAE